MKTRLGYLGNYSHSVYREFIPSSKEKMPPSLLKVYAFTHPVSQWYGHPRVLGPNPNPNPNR